jgi:hypothetical protein
MLKRFKLSLALGAFAALGLAAAQPAQAVIVNGSFETGDFTGWTTTGDATVQNNTFYAPVPNGTQQAVITTSTVNQLGGSPATTNIASLDTFLNLAPGTLEAQQAASGSAFKQSFTATAGDTVTFKWNLLGSDTFPDFAAYTLQGPAGGFATETVLGTVLSAATPINPILGASTFGNETGYQTVNFNIPTTGTYTLGFGVFNFSDTIANAALLVDAVSGATGANPGGGGSAVPLPAAVLVAPLGAMLAGAAGKRLRRKEQAA